MELSYENLVTSGPDPHPAPIADDESDDEDDDDVPRVRFSPHALYCVKKLFSSFTFLYFCIKFDLGLTLGGSLCSSGEGLGDEGVPNHS